MVRWSVRWRLFAGLTLVVVLAANDRLGGLGRTAPMARQTGRPLVLTAVAQDLSATAPRPLRVRWGEAEGRLRTSPHAVADPTVLVAPSAVVVRSAVRPGDPHRGPAWHPTSPPRAPPCTYRPGCLPDGSPSEGCVEEGTNMPTSEIVMQRALELAGQGADQQEAIGDLLSFAGHRRVSLVLARHHLLEEQSEVAERAIALLDEVLLRLPEA